MPRLTKAEFEFLTARKPSMLAQVSKPEPAKPQRESELHKQIQQECHRRGFPMLHGAMHRKTHRTAGEPDFAIIIPPYGRVMFVEAKAKGGKLSEDQLRFHEKAKAAGNQVYTVTSLDDFKRELQGVIDDGCIFADSQHRLKSAMETIQAMKVEAGEFRRRTDQLILEREQWKAKAEKGSK